LISFVVENEQFETLWIIKVCELSIGIEAKASRNEKLRIKF
jgi:hypothetical protein